MQLNLWHHSGHSFEKQEIMQQKKHSKIFVVDDDVFSLTIYEQHLRGLGYTDVFTFATGTDCLNQLTQMPDVIFLDHGLDDLNGIEVLKKIKRFDPDIYVVFISGQENIETAVNSLKYGAFDYIVKGGNDVQRMENVLEKTFQVKELLKKNNKGFFKKLIPIL
jgi:DNA-binding NtrC family response regulator